VPRPTAEERERIALRIRRREEREEEAWEDKFGTLGFCVCFVGLFFVCVPLIRAIKSSAPQPATCSDGRPLGGDFNSTELIIHLGPPQVPGGKYDTRGEFYCRFPACVYSRGTHELLTVATPARTVTTGLLCTEAALGVPCGEGWATAAARCVDAARKDPYDCYVNLLLPDLGVHDTAGSFPTALLVVAALLAACMLVLGWRYVIPGVRGNLFLALVFGLFAVGVAVFVAILAVCSLVSCTPYDLSTTVGEARAGSVGGDTPTRRWQMAGTVIFVFIVVLLAGGPGGWYLFHYLEARFRFQDDSSDDESSSSTDEESDASTQGTKLRNYAA